MVYACKQQWLRNKMQQVSQDLSPLQGFQSNFLIIKKSGINSQITKEFLFAVILHSLQRFLFSNQYFTFNNNGLKYLQDRVSGARLGQRPLPADSTSGTTYGILVQVTNLRLDEIVEKPVHRFIIIEHNEKLYQVGELYTLEHFSCGQPLFITMYVLL